MHRLDDLVQIGEAAKIRGVSIDTLRRWERAGKLKAEKTFLRAQEISCC
jgi:putative resolvase